MSLDSAQTLLQRWRGGDASTSSALAIVEDQSRKLRSSLGDSTKWNKLVQISRRTIDPWFVTDWPETFDPLVLVVPLCHAVDWQCATCPIGRQQHGQTCANPESPVSRLGASIVADERERAQSDALVFTSMLEHAGE